MQVLDCGLNECRVINSVDFVLVRKESFETPPSTMTQHHNSYCCSSPIHSRLMFLPHRNHDLPHAFKEEKQSSEVFPETNETLRLEYLHQVFPAGDAEYEQYSFLNLI